MGLAVQGVVLATRFSSELMEAAPEAVKGALGDGRFEDLHSDPRALVDAAAAHKLRADLAAPGPGGAALAQALLDSLGVALREALDSVFVGAAIAAALSLALASLFRIAVRPKPASGDTNDIDGKRRP